MGQNIVSCLWKLHTTTKGNCFMVEQIKLTDDKKFSCSYWVNDKIVKTTQDAKEHTFTVDVLPCHIKIYIKPYKTRPSVRINEILVNYGLAQITPWDHMIELKLDKNFFESYFNRIIQSKMDYLKVSKEEILGRVGLNDVSYLVRAIEGNLK